MRNVLRWVEEVAIASRTGQNGPVVDQRVAALRELARNGSYMTGEQFSEVMTTAHFEYYMADALSRQFLADYSYQRGSWQTYCFQDTVPDLRQVKRFRMTQPGKLYRRGEKGESEATHLSDSEIQYGVYEFARQLDLSWQDLVNDDLGKIRQAPRMMATMASLWLDEWVSALYDNATTQATIAALGAPWAGTGMLTPQNLAVGINAMAQRTDADGNRIQWRRLHLVIPAILEIQARQILQNVVAYGGTDSNVLGQFLSLSDVHIDPFIDTTLGTPWYLFADPSEANAVTVARMVGVPTPFVVKKASNIQQVFGSAPAAFLMGSYETGDIEYTVEDLVGGWDNASYVGVTDYLAMYYSDGTTP